MKYVSKILVGATLSFLGLQAHSQTYYEEFSKTVFNIGVQGAMPFVAFHEPFGNPCKHGVIYISPDRKSLYAMLMAAKLTEKTIIRIGYTMDPATVCMLELAEIAD